MRNAMPLLWQRHAGKATADMRGLPLHTLPWVWQSCSVLNLVCCTTPWVAVAPRAESKMKTLPNRKLEGGSCFIWLVMGVVAFAATSRAVSPTPDELGENGRWVAAKFEGAQQTRPVEPGLWVLAN